MAETKRAIVFGAHNDDPEFGAGGTTALLHDMGWEILYVCVARKRRLYKKDIGSERERLWSDPAVLEEYARQVMRSAELLGAKKVLLGKLDNSFYFWGDAEVRELVDILEDFKPDIAFTHWMKDNHYEHVETARITMLALSYSVGCEVYAYEAGPWQSTVYFLPDFTINITPAMDRLEQSLMCYDQPTAKGNGLVKEKKAEADLRGHMSGYKWGESFKVLRWPTGRDPELILPKLFHENYKWGGSAQYMWGDQYSF